MSIDNFVSYLQQILSMIDPKNKYSIALGKSALTATIAMAIASGKVDGETHRAMIRSEAIYDYLVNHAKDFAGVPGQYEENAKRRRRLLMSISPSC